MKPLTEWTLQEAKAECASRSFCSEPTFCIFRDDEGGCRIGYKKAPYQFKLIEEEES